MNFVVIDLEWNQALSSNSPVFNKLPLHLRGEIIEIGAVKLNEDYSPGEEFSLYIKPVYFKKMHYKVKKITGIDGERLSHAVSFSEAFDRFHDWCGEDVTFLTWGNDDQGIMEQNIIIHDQDWDWIHAWINLQVIYNIQTASGKDQKSLATAMEHFGIEQTRTAHDALGDAYNTALVSTHLDLADVMRQYADADRLLSPKTDKVPDGPVDNPADGVLLQEHYSDYESKASAFNDDRVSKVCCPECGAEMTAVKWLNQGDQRYINLFICEEHGEFFVRKKKKKHADENLWDVRKNVYYSDKSHQDLYREKQKQLRRRGRRHANHNNR